MEKKLLLTKNWAERKPRSINVVRVKKKSGMMYYSRVRSFRFAAVLSYHFTSL